MLRSFADKDTGRVWLRRPVRKWDVTLRKAAYRKLIMLNAATNLDEHRLPPGNRLEGLKGDRRGQHSIRINQQWRICFRWIDDGAEGVEITDYH